MSEDCKELKEELHEHEEKSFNLFREAESLHQKALQSPASKRVEAMREAFAKQREAIKEIHAVEAIKNKVKEENCEDTPNQSSDLEGE